MPRHPVHTLLADAGREATEEELEALAASVSTFELARLMGTSVAMIDRTYGHLARDSEESIRARLDTRADGSGVGVQLSASDPRGIDA